MSTVLVSGANGYIALHIVKQLIEKGHTVIGTVRREATGEDLSKKFPKNFSFEVVPSLLSETAFNEVFQKHPEIEYFLHTASPVSFHAEDNIKEIVDPAIQGTTLALVAAHKYGKNLKHFVYTSSGATLSRPGATDDVNEELWNDISLEEAKSNSILAYFASKTLAEKKVWSFAKEEKPQFTVNTVLPSYVFGPQAFDKDAKDLNISVQFVTKLVGLKETDEIPAMAGPFSDVRDVARFHVEALKPETYGKRLIVTDPVQFTNERIVALIKKNFPKLNLPKADLNLPVPPQNYKAEATRKLVNFEYVTLEQLVVDTVRQFLKE